MKTVINCTQIKSSKNFENNILKYFSKHTGDIYLDQVSMERNKGLGGAYLNKVEFVIDGRLLTLKMAHNDSMGWDEYKDWESHDRKYQNWAKSTVLYLLAENKELINDFFFEEELQSNI